MFGKQFESFSRTFTDVLPKRVQNSVDSVAKSQIVQNSLNLLVIWLVGLFILLSVSSYFIYASYRATSAEHAQEVQRLSYWQDVITQRPDYPAAYYQAAVSSVRLHDPFKALNYLQKALMLDPNFSQAEVFAQEIEKGS